MSDYDEPSKECPLSPGNYSFGLFAPVTTTIIRLDSTPWVPAEEAAAEVEEVEVEATEEVEVEATEEVEVEATEEEEEAMAEEEEAEDAEEEATAEEV